MAEASDADVEAVLGETLDESDREALRSLQELMRPLIFQAAEQTAATARWLLASLLAVNGGAIIAALNSPDIGGAAERWAIMSWLIGILFALGSGLMSMYNGQRGVSIASGMLSKITQSLHNGVWHDLRFDKQQKEIERRTKRSIALGIVSEVAFVIGALLAAV